jgi:hypothetical protein
MLKNADNSFDINIQLFALSGSDTSVAAPASVDTPAVDTSTASEGVSTLDTATTTDPQTIEELYDRFNGANATDTPVVPEVAPAVTPEVVTDVPVVPTPDIPAKFKNPDGTLNTEALLQSYKNLEPKLSEYGTTIKSLNDRLSAAPQPAPQVPQTPETPQSQPQATQEQVDAMKEKFMDDFYERGPVALMELFAPMMENVINQKVMPQIQPYIQREEHSQKVDAWTTQVEQVKSSNPDFEQYKDTMIQILDEPVMSNGQQVLGEDGQPMSMGEYLSGMPNAVEVAYNLAKGRQASSMKTPEQLLSDPNFLSQAAQHPEIRKMILTQHVQNIQSGQPPTVISSQPAGSPPATPANSPQSALEAGSLVKQWLSKIGI